jgi:hypothetical protein
LKTVIKSQSCRARLRIETGGRLVEEEQLGTADERAGEGEPLFLAAGEIRDAGAPFFLQLHEANHVATAGPCV